jgi:hypothetical protein
MDAWDSVAAYELLKELLTDSKIPRPEHLSSIAGGFGAEHGYGEPVEEYSGDCAMGSMGRSPRVPPR